MQKYSRKLRGKWQVYKIDTCSWRAFDTSRVTIVPHDTNYKQLPEVVCLIHLNTSANKYLLSGLKKYLHLEESVIECLENTCKNMYLCNSDKYTKTSPDELNISSSRYQRQAPDGTTLQAASPIPYSVTRNMQKNLRW